MLTPSNSTESAGLAGMASGAQIGPLAQQLAQQIAAGMAPMPTTTEGWQNLVAQFGASRQSLNTPSWVPSISSALGGTAPATGSSAVVGASTSVSYTHLTLPTI